MAQSDFWSQGRILIAGDSRVRRLRDVPDPVLSTNVDYVFEGGILIDDLVTLVDKNLNDKHKVIIVIGLVGDEIQRFVHHINEDTSATLICSKESSGVDKVLASVQIAHTRWLSLKSERIILWALPYYVDYVGYNSSKVGEYDMGTAFDTSLESSRLFVNYVTRLQCQLQSSMPEVSYCLLNRVLFEGRANTNLFKTFSAVSATEYKFPLHFLSDGLHPSLEMAKKLWSFLHKSVCNVHDRLMGRETVSSPSPGSKELSLPKYKKTFKAKIFHHSKQHIAKRPYTHKKINLHFQKAPVHTRIYHPQAGDTVEELIEEDPVVSHPNLSWKAPHYQSQQGATQSHVYENQPGPSSWSWAHHRRVISEAKMSVYTKGLREQVEAKGRLATIIRERGLWAASQGQIDTVNVAANKWMVKQHSELNAPHADAKLVQEDLSQLLPVDDSSDSEDNET